MNSKHHKSIVILLILLVTVLIVSTGCRRPDDPQHFDSVETPDEIVTPDDEPAETEEPEAETVQSEGRYVGFADSRSVEIELIDAEYDFMVFQLDNSVREQLEESEPETGALVKISFIVSEIGQPMITELEEL